MSSFAFNVSGPTSAMMLDFSLDEISAQQKKAAKEKAKTAQKKAPAAKKKQTKKAASKAKKAKPAAPIKRAVGKNQNRVATRARGSTKAAAAKAKAVAKVHLFIFFHFNVDLYLCYTPLIRKRFYSNLFYFKFKIHKQSCKSFRSILIIDVFLFNLKGKT